MRDSIRLTTIFILITSFCSAYAIDINSCPNPPPSPWSTSVPMGIYGGPRPPSGFTCPNDQDFSMTFPFLHWTDLYREQMIVRGLVNGGGGQSSTGFNCAGACNLPKVSTTDLCWVHLDRDFEFHVTPLDAQGNLDMNFLAPGNIADSGPACYPTIGVETEYMYYYPDPGPSLIFTSDHMAGLQLPRYFGTGTTPQAGDEVAVMGNLVWDCGHTVGDRGYRTEIHPSVAMAWVQKDGPRYGILRIKAISRTQAPFFSPSEGGLHIPDDYTSGARGAWDKPFDVELSVPDADAQDGYLRGMPIYIGPAQVDYSATLGYINRREGCHISSIDVIWNWLRGNPEIVPNNQAGHPWTLAFSGDYHRPVSSLWDLSVSPSPQVGRGGRVHISLTPRGAAQPNLQVVDNSDHGSIQFGYDWQGWAIRNPALLGVHYIICQPACTVDGVNHNSCPVQCPNLVAPIMNIVNQILR